MRWLHDDIPCQRTEVLVSHPSHRHQPSSTYTYAGTRLCRSTAVNACTTHVVASTPHLITVTDWSTFQRSHQLHISWISTLALSRGPAKIHLGQWKLRCTNQNEKQNFHNSRQIRFTRNYQYPQNDRAILMHSQDLDLLFFKELIKCYQLVCYCKTEIYETEPRNLAQHEIFLTQTQQ